MNELNDKQKELLAGINGYIESELTGLKLYLLNEHDVIEVLEKLIKMRKDYIEDLIPKPLPGDVIKEFAKRAVKTRERIGTDFKFTFNDVDLTVEKDDTWKSLYWEYRFKLKKDK